MKITQQEQLFQLVITKAWEDNVFKQELMDSPLAAIEKLTGVKMNIPEGKTLIVRDQTDESTVYINIPAAQKTEDIELNEEQLELVAGGMAIPTILNAKPEIIECFPTPIDDSKPTFYK